MATTTFGDENVMTVTWTTYSPAQQQENLGKCRGSEK